ncbi:hypothetical protein PR048_013080 [Dryococelus australis]|uniref:Uncharacterized protein n=1 Tax=Dryococelus australis TaxID=614101 RepID=A0ABQ9HSN6_9NEOP|nr:hypothetical protein PR048_013080 [Dryococelus australis]
MDAIKGILNPHMISLCQILKHLKQLTLGKKLELVLTLNQNGLELQNKFEKCKIISKTSLICKQMFPLISTYDNGECEVKLLRDPRVLPSDCNKHITLWIPLTDNEWSYVSPQEEIITIICNNAEPFDDGSDHVMPPSHDLCNDVKKVTNVRVPPNKETNYVIG